MADPIEVKNTIDVIGLNDIKANLKLNYPSRSRPRTRAKPLQRA